MATTRQELRALLSVRGRSEQRAYARADFAPLPLRLMLGFGFMYHGFPKMFSSAAHLQLAGMLEAMGIPLPETMAWVVGIVEFFGGALLVVGVLVRVVSVLGIINMLVALFTVHRPHGFSFLNIVDVNARGEPVYGMPGYEVNLLYIAGFLVLLITGAGAISVQRAVRPKKKRDEGKEPVST